MLTQITDAYIRHGGGGGGGGGQQANIAFTNAIYIYEFLMLIVM